MQTAQKMGVFGTKEQTAHLPFAKTNTFKAIVIVVSKINVIIEVIELYIQN